VGSGFAIGMCGKLLKRSVFKQRTLRKRARLFAADAASPVGLLTAQGGHTRASGFAEYGRNYCSATMR
jgi:hypothetical protein